MFTLIYVISISILRVSNLFSDKIKLGTASMQVVKVCDVLLALAKLRS